MRNPIRFSKLREGGFTLIELVAVIAVMVIISGVLLVNYTKFGNSVLLTNLAYDISLSIRQAQQFGTAVRGTTSGSFNTGYGVRFTKADTTHYSLFADTNRDHVYENDGVSPDDVVVETYAIRRGSSIQKFCGTPASAPEECSPDISHLDIVFDRPRPGSISDAFISSNIRPDYVSARIFVENPQVEKIREVIVESTGQISVQ